MPKALIASWQIGQGAAFAGSPEQEYLLTTMRWIDFPFALRIAAISACKNCL